MGNEGRVRATGAFLSRTPFVGRESESGRLRARLEEARAGRGGLVMLVGEPGIGKTRTAEEFAQRARHEGATVLWGRCYDGEWSPPYGPFAEAIAEYVHAAPADALRADLGFGAPPIARLVPALAEKLPGIEEPALLQPDEERFRLLDAVSQLLIAVSRRAPVVLVLDDLHWADKGTIAMLRHAARFARQNRILIAGAYRDVELDSEHPLSGALGQLRHETDYERLLLKGLEREEVGELLTAIAEQDVPQALIDAISVETEGNPFFIRETVLHLIDTGALYREDGVWMSDALSIEELGIPEGVRQVVAQRLSRLSESANRLLTAAAAFNGVFRFEIAARVAEIEEQAALEAVDQALAAQVLRPGSAPGALDFTHALFRHTLYTELSPPRQARLHRQIAEAMESTYRERSIEHAAELAYHYERSSSLPGAERGAEYAIAAADRAEAAYAHDETAAFLRIALALLPEGDARQPRLLGRLGVALIWALQFDQAQKVAGEAGALIAKAEGEEVAAEFLSDAAGAIDLARAPVGSCFALAEQGLRYAGGQRNATWVRLMGHELTRRRAEDPHDPGLFVETPEQREVWRVIEELPPDQRAGLEGRGPVSREDVIARFAGNPFALATQAGEFQRCLRLLVEMAEQREQQGQIAQASMAWSALARCHNALGDFAAARNADSYARALAMRVPGVNPVAWFGLTITEMLLAMDGFQDEHEREQRQAGENLARQSGERGRPNSAYAFAAAIRGLLAFVCARLGRTEEAVGWLEAILVALERGAPSPPWSVESAYSFSVLNIYGPVSCDAAATLWFLERTDHIEVVERGIREKVVAPDFRCPMRDGRHALAQLCALQGRHDEAVEWFAKAREVLDEQGARPLRAIVDYDEALMYVRRGRRGDRNRAAPLVEAALSQFREIGMTGWITRGEELRRQIAERTAGQPVYPDRLTPREVDVLRLITRGRTNAGIASDLTLSVRTVGRHVTNLYNKIHARNRAEAVDYAHRHDLK
jgi:DNA-binding CsgD family transcriptional regulator